MNTTQTKRCGRCHETKPVTEFHRHTRRDEYQGYCKPCANAARREWMATLKRDAETARRQCEEMALWLRASND